MNKKNFIGFVLLLLTAACNLPVSTPEAESASAQTPLSTPVTVSAAPSLVPAETATPTPEPPPLYFTEEFDSTSPFWEFIQAGGVTSAATRFDGGLHIDFSAPDTWVVGINDTHTYANVFVRAKTSITPNGSTGLICRHSQDGWYEFNAAPNGSYSILFGQWLAPGVAKYVSIVNAESGLLTESTSLELGLFCEGDFLHTFVNGSLLRRVDVTNYGLTEGYAGIAAASFSETPAAALFEWFSVAQN